MSPATERWSDEELRTNVGQLFIVSFHGFVPSEDIKNLVAIHKVGSVILFQRNVKDSSQLIALTSELQQIAKQSGHSQPLFISTDQENGFVTRIKEPVAAQLPGPMALAASGDTQNAYKVGLATAETLKGYGVNFNYAPIADVNSEPKNPVIGVRSPSDNPQTVGRFVSAQVQGLKDGGIIPCVKHFPGHGDTDTDSHFGLPIIPKTKVQLNECELVPFRRAVMEGVDAVMTAHISLPNVWHMSLKDDLKELPASLNPGAIAILREELRHDGLIVSDCLEMDGVRAKYGTAKSALMALKSGTDCVMICHTIAAQLDVIESVVTAVKLGELPQNEIAKSVSRVRALKSKYLSFESSSAIPPALEESFNHQRMLAADIYSKSTTLVRHDLTGFPLSTSLLKVVLITPVQSHEGGGAVESGEPDVEDFVRGAPYTSLIESLSPSLEVVEIQISLDGSLSPESYQIIESAPAVILTSRNAVSSSSQRSFGLKLGKKLGSKLTVIATCEPYDFLDDTEEIKNYITTFEPSIPAFKSAIDILFGLAPPLGRLPVSIPPVNYDDQILVLQGADSTNIQKLWTLWGTIFSPKWSIELPRLSALLQVPKCVALLHEQGFSISYLFEGGTGKLAVVGVALEFRKRGLGTALIARAQNEISKLGQLKSWGVGSSFPRYWPGVPFDIDQDFGEWFVHRGYYKSTHPTARDLFRSIAEDVGTQDTLAKVSKLDVVFTPWTKDTEEETLIKQEANFGNNQAWVNAYRGLAAASQHHEVMVAIDPSTKEQIGWTLMTSPSCPIAQNFAFLPLCPSGENTGLIACVGVDKAARGRGVGLGLLIKAMENLRARGVEGVLIDWVVIRGFYETLGFKPIWEYEAYEHYETGASQ